MEKHKPVCVILHLYYPELWEYFSHHLKKITTEFDLYISTTTDVDNVYGFVPQIKFDDVEDSIISEYPESKIYKLQNKGMDIAPFIYVLNEIASSEMIYDVIIKLHSKKSLHDNPDGTITESGADWRDNLVNALLVNSQTFEFNFSVIKTTDHKMVSSSHWIKAQGCDGWENQYISQEIPSGIYYEFVAGSIFMVDFNLIMNWMKEESIFERYYDDFPLGYVGNHSIAHHIERIFGLLLFVKGYQILKNY
jgi:hypothetical protein